MSHSRPDPDQTDYSAPHSSLILGEEKKDDTIIDIERTDTLESIKEAKSKLMLCIALLESQIKSQARRKKAASITAKGTYYAITMGVLSALGFSIQNLVSNAAKFDNAFSQFEATIEKYPYGYTNRDPAPCTYLVSFTNAQKTFLIGGLTKLGCLNIWQKTLNDQNFACAAAMLNICDVPSLWPGYGSLIILLGILAPTLLSTCMILSKKCMTEKFEKLTLLCVPPPKTETIQRYATKYGIFFSDNASLQEIKTLFEIQLKYVNAYLSRHSIMMGSKEKSAPIHRLFDHKQGGDPNILRDVFKYAELYSAEAETTRYHRTLILGSHSKNARYNHRFMDHVPTDEEITEERCYYFYREMVELICAMKKSGEIKRIPLILRLENYVRFNEAFDEMLYSNVNAGLLTPDQQTMLCDIARRLKHPDGKLYSFFRALNTKDHNNDLIYDRKKIISTILEYAQPEDYLKKYR